MYCFICKESILYTASYAKRPYSLLLYMQRPYYLLHYMQRVHIIYCFICKESLLFTALYAKNPYYLLLYMQSVLIYMQRVHITYCFILVVCKIGQVAQGALKPSGTGLAGTQGAGLAIVRESPGLGGSRNLHIYKAVKNTE